MFPRRLANEKKETNLKQTIRWSDIQLLPEEQCSPRSSKGKSGESLNNAKPIGKIVYYALRIEFQMWESPHLHALIWCDDCPKLTHDNKLAYIDYMDKHVQAYFPSN